MTTIETQKEINNLWNQFKQRNRIATPERQRRIRLCKECNDKGYQVKMDYLGNRHEKPYNETYDVSYYKCPRCQKVWKEYARIEKGIIGRQYENL